jgi:hypothetical protein
VNHVEIGHLDLIRRLLRVESDILTNEIENNACGDIKMPRQTWVIPVGAMTTFEIDQLEVDHNTKEQLEELIRVRMLNAVNECIDRLNAERMKLIQHG